MRPTIAMLLILGVPAGAAEQPPAAPLTLPQALATASARNETREISAARVARAHAQQRQAWAQLLPSVTASAQIQRSSQTFRPFGDKPSGFASDGIDLSTTLFNPAATVGVDVAGVTAATTELDAHELRRGLVFDVATSYLQVVAAEHQADAAQRRRDVAVRLFAEGQARVQAGVATANDQTRNELELASAEVALTNAALTARTTRLALGDLLGVSAAQELEEPPTAEVPAGDVEHLVAYAADHRQDLKSDALRVGIDERVARQQRSGYLPTLGARAGYSYSDPDRGAYADTTPTWSVALVAQWTLFDGGARAAAADAADQSRREDLASLRAAQRHLAVALETAVETLAASQAATHQAEVQVRVARNNLDEVRAKAAQGLATGLQEADANAALFEAESSLIGRRLTADASRFELRRLVGWWPLSPEEPDAPRR